MKLVNPSYEILEQGSGLGGIYEAIERAGRTCYKSTRPEGQTAKDFVDRMIASQHHAMLEHGTVYLKVPVYNANCIDFPHGELDCITHSPYSKISYEPAQELEGLMDWTGREISTECMYITTNYRVLVENDALCLLEYLCEPTEFHEKRVTVKFTSNIHFYKDLTRHRKMSFSIESTNYCNYSKGKFGNELTFIIPAWLNAEEGYYDIDHDVVDSNGNSCEYPYPKDARAVCFWYKSNSNDKPIHLDYIEERDKFLCILAMDEESYMSLIKLGWKARQAAEVLPQATKADIIVTGFISDWEHIFNLRTSIIAETGKPHPELSRLMDPLYNEFKTLKLI